ncbi:MULTISPECIES: hypothetical protein [Halobacterium]|uniref:hypothetical protein n=1 Tax=Halobacterium TaxID=2239 RepID=UPI00073F7B4D|nr:MULTISPECIES: hypothetical protein [Halobacterium]MCG1002872.1 hypothetical protein [Halobacterium noricense]
MSSHQLEGGDDSDGSESGPDWDGYSDYAYVSYQISSAIDNAIDSFSSLQSLHDENSKIKAQQAANARQPILSAAMRLLPELEKQQDANEKYAKMVEEWTEDGVDEQGYIDALKEVNLQSECPPWLYDFVLDLRRAGWELGYLQAGRYEDDEDEDDAHASAREMLKDIYESK